MLAAMDSSIERTVYVRLLNEGTDVYRPTNAVFKEPDIYFLKSPAGYDPEDEHWEFLPGSSVKCVERVLADGCVLVASELAHERER